MRYFYYLIFSTVLFGCDMISVVNDKEDVIDYSTQEKFKSYWYQQKAEMNSYTLTQARYGEERKGEAVLIFVTENFSKSKHVKLDNPSENWNDREPVLKLNYSKKFCTGVYPYSLMTSVFKPIKGDEFSPLKLTTTSQEWCGHTFLQLNRNENGFWTSGFSYFESEGDFKLQLADKPLEDDVFTKIRLDPKRLETGDFKMIPSLMYIRLMHKDIKPYKVNATLENKDSLMVYHVNYAKLERDLEVTFSAKFPYKILSWKEAYMSGWGKSKRLLTTKAELKESMLLDYWNHNSREDSTLRKRFRVNF